MILAPVVVNRKGEQLDLFVELRAKGFVRVRVDGKVHEIDAVPKLAKTTKHTIEVVVDRLKVRAEFKQRLAESYETALRHGDGRAIAVEMDTGARASVLGEVRLPGLQLRAGRARAAAVLVQQSDRRLPALRRPGRDQLLRSEARGRLSAAVAVPPARSRAGTGATSSTSSCCGSLAKHVGFDLERPFAKLPERVQQT